jgi:hypothetical protein
LGGVCAPHPTPPILLHGRGQNVTCCCLVVPFPRAEVSRFLQCVVATPTDLHKCVPGLSRVSHACCWFRLSSASLPNCVCLHLCASAPVHVCPAGCADATRCLALEERVCGHACFVVSPGSALPACVRLPPCVHVFEVYLCVCMCLAGCADATRCLALEERVCGHACFVVSLPAYVRLPPCVHVYEVYLCVCMCPAGCADATRRLALEECVCGLFKRASARH